MKVLVTGATGFVGSHVIEGLSKDPTIELIAACRKPEKLLPSFTGEIRQGDLRDKDYCSSLLKGVDAICHAAAWTSLWGHKEHSHNEFLVPTRNLITAAADQQIKRFIFPSTTSTAAPNYSSNPLNEGIPRDFWPHLCNVINIENELRKLACDDFSVIVLRLGIFVGRRYGMGILPALIPRLKTHLVPWLNHGKTHLPLVDGEDIGQAFHKSVLVKGLKAFESFNIAGPEQPTVKGLLEHLHATYGLPKPHFNVSFKTAYRFAKASESISRITPWEPLVTRSLIHLMEETRVDNNLAFKKLEYKPQVHWKRSVEVQMNELAQSNRLPKLSAEIT